jgi:hypothetical protein
VDPKYEVPSPPDPAARVTDEESLTAITHVGSVPE